jgi:predicted lipoprotein with Yx(FWY)xxD motif
MEGRSASRVGLFCMFVQQGENFIMKLLSASILAAALLAGCGGMSRMASMPDTPTRTADGVLVGPNGMTLYTFDRDTAGSGKSACNGPCATNWPPLLAPETAKPMGAYTIVMRDDGKRQWAYKGWPLYYWSKDARTGDKTGDGVNNVWKIARP